MQDGNPKRVLVVDDNRDEAENLAEILSGEGFEASACLPAGAALEELQLERAWILHPGAYRFPVHARVEASAWTRWPGSRRLWRNDRMRPLGPAGSFA